MAIVWRLGSGYTLGTDYATNALAASASVAITKPSGVADGITLRAFVYSQVSAGAVMTPPTGWTLEVAPTARRGGVYRKFIASAAAETATSYTWSAASSGRIMGAVWICTGEDNSTPLDISGTFSTEATTATAASVSPTHTGDALATFVYWNNSAATTSLVTFPGGQTKLIDVGSPTTGNTSGIAISFEQLSASGATGTRATSASPTPTNMSAVSITYNTGVAATNAAFSGGGAFTADVSQVFSPATAPMSGTGGFSATAAAFAASINATFGGVGALTASAGDAHVGTAPFSGTGSFSAAVVINQSVSAAFGGSGGLSAVGKPSFTVNAPMGGSGAFSGQTPVQKWLASQPNYIAHRGGSADWPEMTMYAYAQAAAWNANAALEVSVIRTSDGLLMASHDSTTDRVFGVHYDITTTPWSTLQTLRTTVGNQPPCLLTDVLAAYPNRIFVIDNKMNSFIAPFLDLLDSWGGPAKIIVKGAGIGSGDATKADAATARGYQTWGYYYHADTASLASTQSHWTILGEDVVGAPPGDSTDWAAIKSYGKPVWAHIIATAAQKTYADTFSPAGYMISGVMEAMPRTGTLAAFSGSGSFSASVVQRYALAANMGGAGTIAYVTIPGTSITVPLGASGSFVAGLNAGQIAAAPFSGSGAFSATVVPTFPVDARFGGTGNLAFAVQTHTVTGYTVYVWDGSTLTEVSPGVWDGTSVIPTEVAEVF